MLLRMTLIIDKKLLRANSKNEQMLLRVHLNNDKMLLILTSNGCWMLLRMALKQWINPTQDAFKRWMNKTPQNIDTTFIETTPETASVSPPPLPSPVRTGWGIAVAPKAVNPRPLSRPSRPFLFPKRIMESYGSVVYCLRVIKLPTKFW